MALPTGHRLVTRETVRLRDLADETFVALPAASGPFRDFWLARDDFDAPPRIGAEVANTRRQHRPRPPGLRHRRSGNELGAHGRALTVLAVRRRSIRRRSTTVVTLRHGASLDSAGPSVPQDIDERCIAALAQPRATG
ncbi:type 2 periplasmic-binding domain-containing protein [Rugosimonospora acidiphila]|uniref:hypothetical protein n=1 Tax=Rugosimonospora acidiphila TaxID=556531 RepID=UPI003CD0B5D6